MKYATFSAEMQRALPELFAHQVESTELLPYEAVDMFLNPAIEEAILRGDEPLLARIFAFIEGMTASEDVEVVNLVWVGVCEHLGGKSEDLLAASRSYMEPRTRDISDQVEIVMHGRDVLLSPAGREAAQRKVSELRKALADDSILDNSRRISERILGNLLRALNQDPDVRG